MTKYIATATLIIVGGLWIIWSQRSDPSPDDEKTSKAATRASVTAKPTDTDGDLKRLVGTAQRIGIKQRVTAAELEALQQEVADLKVEVQRARHTEAEPPAPSLEEDLEREENLRRDLSTGYESEPRDGDWAVETESLLHARLAEASTGLTEVEVDCRTNVCRAELRYDTDPAREEFFSALARGSIWTEAYYAHPDLDDGAPIATAFFLRRGEELPLAP